MKLSLDYDGTVTEDPVTWAKVVHTMQAAGHEVYIVTMRYLSETVNDADFARFVEEAKPTGVVATGRQAKKPFVEKLGLHIPIWIDDNPLAVYKSATEIWGQASPEGTVVIEQHGEDDGVSTVNVPLMQGS